MNPLNIKTPHALTRTGYTGPLTYSRMNIIHNPAPTHCPLPEGVRARIVNNGNGLDMHILEAGFAQPDRPCVLLLHGFPELAYSWRKVLPVLAAAGYHAVAPDQRGYGLTRNWGDDYDDEARACRLFNLMLDCLGLVMALGRSSVAAIIGHDFGSFVAAICALLRPDVFRSVILMSAPFEGLHPVSAEEQRIHEDLAKLSTPRKHYQWYFSSPEADTDMRQCPQGIHLFLRAYFHVKSADWPHNQPSPLASWAASELAKMPAYYIMEADKDMPATVVGHQPSADQIAACDWLPDSQLRVYSEAFTATGFQEALYWYRCMTSGAYNDELLAYSTRKIIVPACYIAGANDWGTYQRPGALEAMQNHACTHLLGTHLIEGAGHWVQQEQSQACNRLLLDFLHKTQSGPG